MIIALIVMLIITAFLPLVFKPAEKNIELFLLIMGAATSITAGEFNFQNIAHIFENRFLYIITAAIIIVSILFRLFQEHVKGFIGFITARLPLKLTVFLLIVALGLLSSIITAIISALILAEVAMLLPLDRKDKVKVCITACFSIGLGAVLTPIGEPLSTIVVTKLCREFTYLGTLLGAFVLSGIVISGLLGTLMIKSGSKKEIADEKEFSEIEEKETLPVILTRAGKVFVFVVALDLLGYGFKPLIDNFVVHWSTTLLYAANLLSSILDNATLAAAEISPDMAESQLKAILISLLVSGGMLITGNIPNIITAGKLKISMKQWAKYGVPIGFIMLAGFYAALFAV